MTNYKEILRLHSLGINNTRIAESCGCARSTVIAALQRAAEQELSWNKIKNCSAEEVARKLYPSTALGQQYKMPDYEWVHRERQKSGVRYNRLRWLFQFPGEGPALPVPYIQRGSPGVRLLRIFFVP